jgi:hypothetical protein
MIELLGGAAFHIAMSEEDLDKVGYWTEIKLRKERAGRELDGRLQDFEQAAQMS